MPNILIVSRDIWIPFLLSPLYEYRESGFDGSTHDELAENFILLTAHPVKYNFIAVEGSISEY